MRDMMKTVEKNKSTIPYNYELTYGELRDLYSILMDEGRDGRWDALTTAFDYGFVLGARAQKAGKFHVK